MADALLVWSGAPTTAGTQVIAIYTVPAGKTWTLKHALIVAECVDTGITPSGGEWTPYIETDINDSYATIAESSLETGNRYASQGSGPIDCVVPDGKHIRLSYFLLLAGGNVAADFAGKITVIYEESP